MANVQGPITARLLAQAGVTALVAVGSIYAGTVPQQARLPHVCVTDEVVGTEWITPGACLEKHRLTVACYAASAAPPATGQPAPANPAEAIADACEAAITHDDLDALFDTCNVLLVHRQDRKRGVEARREHQGERVYRVVLTWTVELEDFAAPYSGG